MKNPPVEI